LEGRERYDEDQRAVLDYELAASLYLYVWFEKETIRNFNGIF
jgi:hypothetical protein